MEFLKDIFQKEIVKKILVLVFFGTFLYLMRSMLNLFLLTFLFTYLFDSLQEYITSKISHNGHINHVLMTLLIYSVFIASIVIAVYRYIPVLISQSTEIVNELSNFKIDPNQYKIVNYFMPIVEKLDLKDYLAGGANQLFEFAANVGKVSFNIFVALILSIFFMLEKKKIKQFILRFDNSRASGVVKYLKYFGKNFLNSFGKVIQAQILIAFINSILSIIALSILKFPQLLALGAMVFIFSLIPVAGTIVSLIPLAIIAFNIGGIVKVIYVIIMIILLHALESYLLNPKLMAAKTNLPVFVIFIILIVSEHFMGVWGLLLGIPLFMFILDLLGVKSR